MNVLLISQCNQRALTETRRILDQFAERRGDRTWQTAITQAGLDTLRKLLRQTARKNTAVACHRIGGKNRSELLWVVGNARQFNEEGAVPTNTTQTNVLRAEDEANWHTLRMIQQLTALAALMHDLGKGSDAFQARLRGDLTTKNLYRHEWTSVRLFQAFVHSCGSVDDDAPWLDQLVTSADMGDGEMANWHTRWDGPHLITDGLNRARAGDEAHAIFNSLPPLAQAVAWLILTHHRLPALPVHGDDSAHAFHGQIRTGMTRGEVAHVLGKINADWNEPYSSAARAAQAAKDVAAYWRFGGGLPIADKPWRQRAARMAKALREQPHSIQPLHNTYVMHVARMALMLGDHHYSSLGVAPSGRPVRERLAFIASEAQAPYANTLKHGVPNQTLGEHLRGVEQHASALVHALPSLKRQLPHLKGHKTLKSRSADARFRWQDSAADLATNVRNHAAEHGAFIVNMASTGCGKTLGNARIMNALANPATGMRCAFAIGLRSLTLQTGRSFQNELKLGDDELAILVGGTASRELFAYYQDLAEQSGSASQQDLLDETTHVLYEGNDQHPVLQQLGQEAGARKLLAAPVLACTVDHLTPATESLRGGRQIAPMLRLMSSDLVLDEPDDFDLADLPALARLVHWAGLLGSRVLLSSATLPPALVEGLFLAYWEGRKAYQHNRGQRPDEVPRPMGLWVDEFARTAAECTDAIAFRAAHLAFALKRVSKLTEQAKAPRRIAQIVPMPIGFAQLGKVERRAAFGAHLLQAAMQLHRAHHAFDKQSGAEPKRVSFGLIRMANIAPLFDVALALFQQAVPSNTRIHLCVYHSQFPLFVRSAIEHRLDTALNRRGSANAVFAHADIRAALDAHSEPEHLFIVLGSPVTEVGRDHDYDWAVVEPSSMRSLIQLAGRVLRHRPDQQPTSPNILVCEANLRHFEQPGQAAYCQPGFESRSFPLKPHQLQQLLGPWLDAQLCMTIDARPRVLPREPQTGALDAQGNLVDLEHVRMQAQMLPLAPPSAAASATPVTTSVRASTRGGVARRQAPASSTSHAVGDFNASTFWLRADVRLTAAMQQAQPFRQQTQQQMDVVLLPTDDEDDYRLHRVQDGEKKWQKLYVEWEGRNDRVAPDRLAHPQISCWGEVDFMAAMQAQADAMALPLRRFAEKFATASLPVSKDNNQGWHWHPWLGFTRRN
ncbi:type I-F CRISPR-associated helicase Cas3f [Ottowia oryzae]